MSYTIDEIVKFFSDSGVRKNLKGFTGDITAFGQATSQVFGALFDDTKDLSQALVELKNASGDIGELGLEFGALYAQTQLNSESVEGLLNKIPGIGKLASLAVGPTLELAETQRDLAAGFNAAVGATGQYDKALQGAIARNLLFDPSGKRTGAAVQELFNTFTDFSINGISPTESALADVAVLLENFGVPVGSSVEAFQTLRKSFGQTDVEIGNTVLGLENFAEELGVSTSQLITDFNNTLPTLAIFGTNAERVFRETAAAAKSSGVEIATFTNLMDLTDTFEGAAETAQGLNAILGGPIIDSFALLNAETPAEKMRLLAEGLRESGISAQDFADNRFLARAVTDQIPGITKTTELLKIMNGDFDSLQGTTDATAKGAGDLVAKLGAASTPEEMLERARMSKLAFDGVGQVLTEMNKDLFPAMLDKIDQVTDKVRDSLKPTMDRAFETAGNFAESLGVTAESLEELKTEAVAGIDERAGQQPIGIQIFIDNVPLSRQNVKTVQKVMNQTMSGDIITVD